MQRRALSLRAASSCRAAISAGAGPAVVADLHFRHQTRPDQAEVGENDRGGGDRVARWIQPAAYYSLRARRDLRERDWKSERRWAGRNFPARSRKLRRAWAMGSRSRAAAVRVRFLVASRLGRGDYQRMGHAENDRERHRARVAPRQQVRSCDSYLESAQPAASEIARPRRRSTNAARATPVARPDQDLRLRRRGNLNQGFVGGGLALASRQRRVESSQGDRNSRRARRRKRAAAGAQTVQGGAAA